MKYNSQACVKIVKEKNLGCDIVEKELQEFLENAIKTIEKDNVKSMALIVDTGEEVLTGYYNCTLQDKQMFASHLNIDVIDAVILANLDRYKLGGDGDGRTGEASTESST